MDAIVKKAQQYFKGNDKKVIWATEDGNFFWDEMFAENHARNYKKKLVKVDRKNAKEEKVVEAAVEKVEEKEIEKVVEETPKKESKPKRKRK